MADVTDKKKWHVPRWTLPLSLGLMSLAALASTLLDGNAHQAFFSIAFAAQAASVWLSPPSLHEEFWLAIQNDFGNETPLASALGVFGFLCLIFGFLAQWWS